MTADLTALKSDLPGLLEALGLERAGDHCPCCHCGSRDALSVHHTESGWRFNCHACGTAGSVIDAVALADRCTPAEAIKRLAGPSTPRRKSNAAPAPRPPPEPKPPKHDRARLDRFLAEARRTLRTDQEVQDRFMHGKRGLTLAVCEALGLGFLPRVTFKEWPSWHLENCWAIPVAADESGRPVAVKLHCETPAPKSPKSLWAPFGTEVDPLTGKARHGFATLWPCPELGQFAERRAIMEIDGKLSAEDAQTKAGADIGFVYLTEGELKAAAVLTAGKDALSVTAGASFHWTPALLARLAGRRCCVVFDDDDAGHRFRDNALAALSGVALELRAVSFGQKGTV